MLQGDQDRIPQGVQDRIPQRDQDRIPQRLIVRWGEGPKAKGIGPSGDLLAAPVHNGLPNNSRQFSLTTTWAHPEAEALAVEDKHKHPSATADSPHTVSLPRLLSRTHTAWPFTVARTLGRTAPATCCAVLGVGLTQ